MSALSFPYSLFLFHNRGMHRGIATFTLDTGKCPKWLFERMVKLGREITRVLIEEYGPREFVKRVGDPVWFQSLGTVLAFDWNASGLTTILTAALKEALRGREREFGVFVCGGKGATSRKTPEEIMRWGEWLALPESYTRNLVYNSKMSAKVDSALIQDGFQLYHHAFFFSRDGAWTVVQQGMNQERRRARRYHWHSAYIKDLVCEPHAGISSEGYISRVLNLVAAESRGTRDVSTQLIRSGYHSVMKDVKLLRKHSSPLSRMVSIIDGKEQLTLLDLEGREFKHHPVILENFWKSTYLERILARVTYEGPTTYEQFVGLQGVGPKTARALALIAEIIYGAPPSYKDPARYSFAHGGKDATPYPVDRITYDQSIQMLLRAVERSRIGGSEKFRIFESLRESEKRGLKKMP